MINPDERVARCLMHLRAPEFKPLVDYWTAWLADTHKKLVDVQDTNQLLRLQGEGKTLAKILDGVQQADEMLRKLKR